MLLKSISILSTTACKWLFQPEAAYYHDELGEFILPYEAVRTANEPDTVLLDFLQSTYEAAADLASWDRNQLERKSDPRRNYY